MGKDGHPEGVPTNKMYLHIGENALIQTKNIIGIFDLDTSTVSKHTRDYLRVCEKQKQVINVTEELPKAFILYKNNTVYISQLATATLVKRMET